jgi:hypothetical protein
MVGKNHGKTLVDVAKSLEKYTMEGKIFARTCIE